MRFAPLTLAQRVQAFQRYFAEAMGDGMPEAALLTQALYELDGLTLGDFHAATQHLLFSTAPVTTADLVQRLRHEWQYHRRKPIMGF